VNGRRHVTLLGGQIVLRKEVYCYLEDVEERAYPIVYKETQKRLTLNRKLRATFDAASFSVRLR